MKVINILGLAASAAVASALAANNGSDIQKLPAKDVIIDCDGSFSFFFLSSFFLFYRIFYSIVSLNYIHT